jgi:hypothetical protein
MLMIPLAIAKLEMVGAWDHNFEEQEMKSGVKEGLVCVP